MDLLALIFLSKTQQINLYMMNIKSINTIKALSIHILAIVYALLLDSSFGYALRPGYALATYLLLITVSPRKILFLILVTVLSIMSAIYAPASFLFGSPNVNIVLSIMGSNIAESYEFLSFIPIKYYLFSMSILIIGTLLIINSNALITRHIKTALLIFLIIVFSRPIFSIANSQDIEIGFTPVRFVNDFYKAVKIVREDNARLKALINMKTTLAPTKASEDFDSYILVIGESARRDFMGVYGFRINNTPFMNSSNGIIFNNYISAASSTQTSISTSFIANGVPQNNLLRLAHEQGLETWWISNQGSYGDDDSQVSIIGKQADNIIFLKKGEYKTTNSDDTELLPHIKEALQSQSKHKLIIVHLMGSHEDFCERTNNKYDVFYVNKSLSCYVQSIKNTDKLLSTIAQQATNDNKKWTMMYFSDHGLSFIKKNKKKYGEVVTLIHGDKTKENFDIPLFITSYNAKDRTMKTFPYSAMNFLSLYLYWTGSIEKTISDKCNPLAKTDCKINNISVIDYKHNLINYSNLASEPAQ